jgi:prolipoprotein diacylglyceryl transferase
VIAVLASIPSPSSGSISIGPLNLRMYGLMIALGVIAAVWLAGRMLERKGMGTTDDASSVAIYGVVAGIIGARLYHVVTDWERFSDNLSEIPMIWHGGLGIPGGLLFGTLAGVWQAKRRGIPPSVMLTCGAPAIALAQAIGRWGNWFNQELFGRATDLPWALEIDDAHLPAGYESGTTFHPTFLYESLWNFGLAALLVWIDRRLRLGPGRLMAVYLMGYGTGRFWVEGLRIDPADHVAGLRWNQWVALAAVVAGAIWLLVTWGQKWPDDLVREDVSPDEMPVDESGGTYFADDGSALDPDAATVVDDAPDDVRTDDDAPDDVRTDDDAPDDVRTDEVRQTGELDDAAAGLVDPDRGHLDESAEDDQVGDSSGRSADDEPADPS